MRPVDQSQDDAFTDAIMDVFLGMLLIILVALALVLSRQKAEKAAQISPALYRQEGIAIRLIADSRAVLAIRINCPDCAQPEANRDRVFTLGHLLGGCTRYEEGLESGSFVCRSPLDESHKKTVWEVYLPVWDLPGIWTYQVSYLGFLSTSGEWADSTQVDAWHVPESGPPQSCFTGQTLFLDTVRPESDCTVHVAARRKVAPLPPGS